MGSLSTKPQNSPSGTVSLGFYPDFLVLGGSRIRACPSHAEMGLERDFGVSLDEEDPKKSLERQQWGTGADSLIHKVPGQGRDLPNFGVGNGKTDGFWGFGGAGMDPWLLPNPSLEHQNSRFLPWDGIFWGWGFLFPDTFPMGILPLDRSRGVHLEFLRDPGEFTWNSLGIPGGFTQFQPVRGQPGAPPALPARSWGRGGSGGFGIWDFPPLPRPNWDFSRFFLGSLREALQEPAGAELPLCPFPPGRGGGRRQGRFPAPHSRLPALRGAEM